MKSLASYCRFCKILLFIAIMIAVGAISSRRTLTQRSSRTLQGGFVLTMAATTESYDLEAWKKGFSTCAKEICEKLPGTVPKDIKGTYYRNGYGKFEVGKDKVMHPFDADGMMCAITIEDGNAIFRNRIIRTAGYVKEQKARRILYRGAFGTQRQGGALSNIFDVNIKNVANTNAMYWGNRLFALWEGGLPHRLEPDSLRTIGEYTFKGLLKKSDKLSAHPRFDADSNRMVTFTTDRSPSASTLNCIEFDPDLKVMTQRQCEVPGFVFFHDFIVTKNWYIFDQAPVKFNPLPFLLGTKGPAQCIDFDPSQPAVIHLIPRNPSKEYQKLEVDSHFNFHFANAFEDDDGKVIFDIVRCSKMTLGDTSKSANPIWEDIDYAEEVPYSVLSRYTLTPPPISSSGAEIKGKWTYSCKDLSKTQVDFTSVSPAVSCKKHRYVYASCGSDLSKSTPVQGVVKIDTVDGTEQKWFGEKYEYMGEAIFIPRIKTTEHNLDEDDGYVFTLLFNGKSNTAEFLIFDAQKISEGPISRQPISTNIPYGLHGTWANGLTFSEDDINRKWKAAVSIESKNWGEVKSDFSGLGISFGS